VNKSKENNKSDRQEKIEAKIRRAGEHWDFAGWGTSSKITRLGSEPVAIKNLGVSKSHAKKLGEWFSTAICGNDITSSCLYVSAFAVAEAGILAPLVLLLVAAILFLFRKVYTEVISAIPLNGGTYTVLLNTSNKKIAAIAACLTLLSYIATAVISSYSAMSYLSTLIPSLSVMWATVGLLGFFAFLNLIGIVESAAVALGIFIFHIVTLVLVVIAGSLFWMEFPEVFNANRLMKLPEGRGIWMAVFYGFGAAMLGISGFESSANFIEEQKEGVFPKTLRNMWIAVSVFNPLICLIALSVLSQSEILESEKYLLASLGSKTWGTWFKYVISIDAVLVLSGAVLTSYVGVIGLVRRMSVDRCLPQFFLKENSWRRTNHLIILGFFLLCTLILVVTTGQIKLLAGVYTLSFLCVMALFAIGNLLLKQKRGRMPRAVTAPLWTVIVALLAVIVGIFANLTVENVKVFSIFFALMAGTVAIMFLRVPILKMLFVFSSRNFEGVGVLNYIFGRNLLKNIDEIVGKQCIYFSRGDNISNLNRAALYVLENEQTTNLQVIHVYEDDSDIPGELATDLKTLDKLYPHLRIDFLAIHGKFSPELVERISRFLDVPKNYMFIGTPGDSFAHNIASLGGVRLII